MVPADDLPGALMTPSTKLAATCLVAVTSCLLAACSGTTSGHAATGGSTAAQAGVAASAAPGGSSGSANCKQLTFADVQPLLIEKVVSVDVTAPEANGSGQECVFTGKATDRTGAVDVLVLTGSEGTQAYAEDVAGESDGPVAVAGIGDKATRDKGDGQVSALKGSTYCSVTLSDSDDVPGVGPLEEAAGSTTHIAESAYDTVAKALGTLCNRIYGSGNTTPDLSSLLAADATAVPSDGGGLPTDVSLPTDASS
jgi:hypothetical protein